VNLRPELTIEELSVEVMRRIAEEQGKPIGLMVAKNLPMLPTETAWRIVNVVVEQRGSLFDADDDDVATAQMKAFMEGLLCGLRIQASITELQKGK
jgi:hypothetical protein